MALPIYEQLLFPKSLLLLQSDKLPKEFKKLLAAGANSAPFCGISHLSPTKITVLFFPRVVKSPTNYVLSKLHVTAELVLLLMYIKTSWVSQTVGVWMAVPLTTPGACGSAYSRLPFVLLASFYFVLLHS